MKIYTLLLLFFGVVAGVYGQQSQNFYGQVHVEIIKERKDRKIYAKVMVDSFPPGRDSAWLQSVENRINQALTYRNGAKTGKYFAAARFIVTKDGHLSDVVCHTDPGYGICLEIVRAIKLHGGGKWVPAAKPVSTI